MENHNLKLIEIHIRCIEAVKDRMHLELEIKNLQLRRQNASDDDAQIYNDEINRRQEKYHELGLRHRGDVESLIDITNG